MARRTATAPSAAREALSTLAFCGVCLVIVVALAVLPARTWWAQRQALSDVQQRKGELLYRQVQLEAELERLATDDEIERQARANYDMVFPGEESFRILNLEDEGE